jgi:hypothetical protein
MFNLILKLFSKKQNTIKIACFGIINNPEYRQEPWKESIAQRLLMFDFVCLVCGNKSDLDIIQIAFPKEYAEGKLILEYKEWPFPYWSYEELPKHLNRALELARNTEAEWLIKLDIDTTFHEKDIQNIRNSLVRANIKNKKIVSFKKMQFFSPYKYWIKGYLPIALKGSSDIFYGFAEDKYTDLCQPIIWDRKSFVEHKGKKYLIPSGSLVQDKDIYRCSSIKLFNYDYTMRTYERSLDLLYYIEIAHARFWGEGYSGKKEKDITKESAMSDFLTLSLERYKRMNKKMSIDKHPFLFRGSLEALGRDQWGFSLWGKL